jgi:hypothetical protein
MGATLVRIAFAPRGNRASDTRGRHRLVPRRQPGLEQSCTAVLEIARKLVVLGRKIVVHAEVGRSLEYLLDVIPLFVAASWSRQSGV